MRKAIGVRLRERRRVYEGEVVQLEVKTRRHPYNPYQEIPDHVVIGLATRDDRRTFRAGATIASYILSQGITVGDMITIDVETGRVTRIGRSEEAAEKYDLATVDERPVPRPGGQLRRRRSSSTSSRSMTWIRSARSLGVVGYSAPYSARRQLRK